MAFKLGKNEAVMIGGAALVGVVAAYVGMNFQKLFPSRAMGQRARARSNLAIIGDEVLMSGTVTDHVLGEGYDKGNEAYGRSDPLFNSLTWNPKDFMYNSIPTRQIYNKLGTPPIITTSMKLSGSHGPCAPASIHEFSPPGTNGY